MGSAPKPPNPYQTASAQQQAETGASIASGIIGNPNTYTPYGSQTYSIAGWEQVPDARGKMISVPRYNMQQTLSPDQMRLLGLQTQGQYNMGLTAVEQSAKLRGLLGQSVNAEGLQGWNAGPGAENVRQDKGATDRAAIENAMMASYNRQRMPQQSAEDAQLAARGLSPGGGVYGNVQRGREDAFSEAARQSYLASGQESRAAQDADRANALRQSQLSERLALRNQPLNEISALLAGSQVTLPQFQGYQSQGINAAPIGQYIGNNYAQQMAAHQNQQSGLFGLGGSALGAAGTMLAAYDRRLKEDIHKIEGHQWAGLPLYWFRYKAEPKVLRIGVMADEVRRLHPDAVTVIDGYDYVDYGLLFERQKGH